MSGEAEDALAGPCDPTAGPRERLSLVCGDTGGRTWVRTKDLFGVNEARYHCAIRP